LWGFFESQCSVFNNKKRENFHHNKMSQAHHSFEYEWIVKSGELTSREWFLKAIYSQNVISAQEYRAAISAALKAYFERGHENIEYLRLISSVNALRHQKNLPKWGQAYFLSLEEMVDIMLKNGGNAYEIKVESRNYDWLFHEYAWPGKSPMCESKESNPWNNEHHCYLLKRMVDAAIRKGASGFLQYLIGKDKEGQHVAEYFCTHSVVRMALNANRPYAIEMCLEQLQKNPKACLFMWPSDVPENSKYLSKFEPYFTHVTLYKGEGTGTTKLFTTTRLSNQSDEAIVKCHLENHTRLLGELNFGQAKPVVLKYVDCGSTIPTIADLNKRSPPSIDLNDDEILVFFNIQRNRRTVDTRAFAVCMPALIDLGDTKKLTTTTIEERVQYTLEGRMDPNEMKTRGSAILSMHSKHHALIWWHYASSYREVELHNKSFTLRNKRMMFMAVDLDEYDKSDLFVIRFPVAKTKGSQSAPILYKHPNTSYQVDTAY